MRRAGFTLIELIITITIIGIISGLAIVNFVGQMAKSRDATRKGDLASLQQSIELYYEKNGSYPVTDGWISPIDLGPASNESLAETLIPAGLIGKIPCDPSAKTNCTAGGGNNYMYYRDNYCGGDATKYSLYAKLENPSLSDSTSMHDSYAKCNQTSKDPKKYNMNYRLGN